MPIWDDGVRIDGSQYRTPPDQHKPAPIKRDLSARNVPEDMAKKKRLVTEDQARFVHGLFREAFNVAEKLLYNAAWYEPSTNSLINMRHDPLVMSVMGKVLASQDSFGRRMIMFPTRYGVMVVYDLWPVGDMRHQLVFNAFLNEKGLKKNGTDLSGTFHVHKAWLVDAMKDLKKLVFEAPAQPTPADEEQELQKSIKELVEEEPAKAEIQLETKENIMNNADNLNNSADTSEEAGATADTSTTKPSFWARVMTALTTSYHAVVAFILMVINTIIVRPAKAVTAVAVSGFNLVKGAVKSTFAKIGTWFNRKKADKPEVAAEAPAGQEPAAA